MWKCNIYSIFTWIIKSTIDQLIFIAIFAFIILVDLITQIKMVAGQKVVPIQYGKFSQESISKEFIIETTIHKIYKRRYVILTCFMYLSGRGQEKSINRFSMIRLGGMLRNQAFHFCLCAEHGTNLAGESPVTGIYCQVQRTTSRTSVMVWMEEVVYKVLEPTYRNLIRRLGGKVANKTETQKVNVNRSCKSRGCGTKDQCLTSETLLTYRKTYLHQRIRRRISQTAAVRRQETVAMSPFGLRLCLYPVRL